MRLHSQLGSTALIGDPQSPPLTISSSWPSKIRLSRSRVSSVSCFVLVMDISLFHVGRTIPSSTYTCRAGTERVRKASISNRLRRCYRVPVTEESGGAQVRARPMGPAQRTAEVLTHAKPSRIPLVSQLGR